MTFIGFTVCRRDVFLSGVVEQTCGEYGVQHHGARVKVESCGGGNRPKNIGAAYRNRVLAMYFPQWTRDLTNY